ncbi:MAG: hypothetical protein KGL39_49820 [Patescibacteria group bacterium]|nr:hypothetical protein [Patescibacteria group bacterium]
MKFLAPFLVIFACFTSPDGHRVWVNVEQVLGVVQPTDCSPNAHAKIISTGPIICVKETQRSVMTTLEQAK